MADTPRAPSNNPLTGAAYLLRGFGLLLRPGVRRYVVAPLLVNVVVFASLLYLLWSQFEGLRLYVEGWLPDWLDVLAWVLLPLLVLLSALVLFFGFSAVGNLLASPFNGFLSQAVERSLGGSQPDTGGDLLDTLREAGGRPGGTSARRSGRLATSSAAGCRC